MTKEIILPRTDKDGKFYISYSQNNTFTSDKGFNTGLPGELEYIQEKFFGIDFPDMGWALFGEDAENYVCYRDKSKEEIEALDAKCRENGNRLISESLNSFSAEEKETMNQIKPLGVFQKEIKINILPDVYLLGYMDDCTEDMMHLRDYKTASANSKSRYYTDDYKQLDIYAMYVLQETGKLPKKLEVCIIERAGNCFGQTNRRDLLTVKNEIWYLERETSLERIEKIKEGLIETVHKISDLYKTYLKTNV